MLNSNLEQQLLAKYEERKQWRTTEEFTRHEAAYDASGAGKNSYIGPMMGFIKALRPASFGEWYMHYMLEQEGVERCTAAADRLREYAPTLNGTEAFRHMVIHSADQTWEGYQREIAAINTLNILLGKIADGLEARLVEHEYDNLYRVDAVIYNEEGQEVMGIQVKSTSYFYRHFHTKEGLPAWQKEATHRAHMRFQYEFDAPTAFIAHDRDGQIYLYRDTTEYDEEATQKPEITYEKGDIFAILETPIRTW